MKYLQDIRAAHNDPKLLEDLYHTSLQERLGDEFKADVLACHEEAPDNVLYAAWYYRLQAFQAERAASPGINWRLAIPLGAITGLVFAVLSLSIFNLPRSGGIPFLILVWAPIGACFITAFLALTANRDQKRAVAVIVSLLVVGAYVTLVGALANRQQYQILMAIHLPLWAWAGVGVSLLGLGLDHPNRFAFLIKSIEVFVVGGVYVIVGGMFAGITLGMFSALGVQMPIEITTFLIAGGGGLITVLAVATVYDPRVSPLAQRFEQGLGKFVPTMMRLLLPLTLAVLVIYLYFIPFNFMQPFRNRDILIVYNIMLFAVMGLLVGATPMNDQDLPQKYHRLLRAGILAVACLTIVVSLYALSATVYRTAMGGFTVNRVTVIGWNVINIGILVALVYEQFKQGQAAWICSLHSVFSQATIPYMVWTIALTALIPWLFH